MTDLEATGPFVGKAFTILESFLEDGKGMEVEMGLFIALWLALDSQSTLFWEQ